MIQGLYVHLQTAIYCRVSKEDEEKGCSESIKNQLTSLTSYVKEKKWQLVNAYLDDGYSGTNFERPGFVQMMEAIEQGRINCVVTKDYSRLGREHIQTSYYTEIFFPKNKVRYIAVNDGIDTWVNDDFLGFRAVFNDMYAKDISKKIRYSLYAKQKEGDFIGAFAPYGYQKDEKNKNRLIVDPDIVPIIQEIFSLYLHGYSKNKIATILNEKDIPSPAVRKGLRQGRWSAVSIGRILENEVYIGHMVQHKSEKISYKINKQRVLPSQSWLKVEHTHEAILTTNTFDQVQKIIAEKRKKR